MVAGLWLALPVSCATTRAAALGTDMAGKPVLKGKLSSTSVVDGSLLRVTVSLERGVKLAAPVPSEPAPSEEAGISIVTDAEAGEEKVIVPVPAGVGVAGLRARFDGRDFPLFSIRGKKAQYEGLIPVPYERRKGAANVEVTAWLAGGQVMLDLPFQVVEGKYPSEVLTVDPNQVTPPASELARIEREGREVSALYRSLLPEKRWSGKFRLPVQSEVTSVFGTRRVYNGVKQGYHKGLDLRAKVGRRVRAPAAGKVVMAKDLYFTGYTVLLDHGRGVITLYGHLSRLDVRKGQKVTPGQILGLAGATGRVNGPHLHWGAIVMGEKVNPLELTKVVR